MESTNTRVAEAQGAQATQIETLEFVEREVSEALASFASFVEFAAGQLAKVRDDLRNREVINPLNLDMFGASVLDLFNLLRRHGPVEGLAREARNNLALRDRAVAARAQIECILPTLEGRIVESAMSFREQRFATTAIYTYDRMLKDMLHDILG